MVVNFLGGPDDGLVQNYDTERLLGLRYVIIERENLRSGVYELRPGQKNTLIGFFSHYADEKQGK